MIWQSATEHISLHLITNLKLIRCLFQAKINFIACFINWLSSWIMDSKKINVYYSIFINNDLLFDRKTNLSKMQIMSCEQGWVSWLLYLLVFKIFYTGIRTMRTANLGITLLDLVDLQLKFKHWMNMILFTERMDTMLILESISILKSAVSRLEPR